MRNDGLSVDEIDMPPFDPGMYEDRNYYQDDETPSEVSRSLIRAAPFHWCDPVSIPLRKWIYGRHYIRRFVSTTVAPGGVGKSSLGIVEALAIVSGRDLLGI